MSTDFDSQQPKKIQKISQPSHIEQLKQVVVVLGSQWGDEGKGKLVDQIAQEFDICARYNGGANAGHTIVVAGKSYAFNLLPSGLLNPNALSLLGNGCVIHIETLLKEMKTLEENGTSVKDRLFISDRAHIVFDLHLEADSSREAELGQTKLGTTKRGIGPAYCDKMSRIGLRIGDLRDMDSFSEKFDKLYFNLNKRFDLKCDKTAEMKKYAEYAKILENMIVDGIVWINQKYKEGKKILLEGANAAMLDIDFGTYPFVTSSTPTIGGCFNGLGLSPFKLGDVIGVVKAYTTRVGEGPFPTEQKNEIGKLLQEKGREFGVVTKRPRRCGWLDLVVLDYTNLINGYTAINLTKLDILSGLDEIKIGVAYWYNGKKLPSMPENLKILGSVTVEYLLLPGWKENIHECKNYSDLPLNCRKYIEKIEELIRVPIKWIGVGPSRDATIEK